MTSTPSARPTRRRRPSGVALRAILGAALVAVGLSVVPLPTLSFVADYRVDHEPLRFTATADESPRSDAPAPNPSAESTPMESDVAEVAPFVTIGVTLPTAPSAPVAVRWRDAAGWSDWRELEVEQDQGPDRSSAEAVAAAAKSPGVTPEPLWVGSATAYQVRLPDDTAPDAPGPEVVVVRAAGGHTEVHSDAVPAGAESYGQPAIHTRGEWGARSPSNAVGSASELKLAVVHHSATGNDYGPGDVPGIIRSIQAFHMDGNGWSDIGYNFIVDKFGGMWEGRDGSLLRNSIGAHAEGFNTGSVGVMALGNYTEAAPTPTQVTNIADVIAWRFATNAVDPSTNVSFTSGGSSSIPAGTVVNLPRVVGHRDVGSTDCPGSNLYAALASRIRPILPTLVAAKASPIGIVDIATGGPRSVLVTGWALDPLVTDPIEVHVYVDGVGHNLGPTPFERPDLAGPYPGAGTRHGFAATVGDLSPGDHSVCVFGINTGPGTNTLLQCRTVTVKSGNPVGALDHLEAGPDGTLWVSGWAVDPDQAAPIEVHVYVDGRGTNLGPAAVGRPDIGALLPAYGSGHGFDRTLTGLAPGSHDVCVFAINAGPGDHNVLGCRTVRTPGGPPTGIVDTLVGLPDGHVWLSGWSLDPDTAGATEVHVYVDGKGTNLGRAAGDRPDIARAFPGYGAAHGFGWLGSGLAAGRHQVCVFAIDTAGGANALLTCRDVTVPGGSPFGVIDTVTAAGSRLGVSGWTIDPDTTAPIEAHVYVDGIGYNTGPAAQSRPDVAAVVVGYGPNHGISWLSPVLAPGAHTVCVFGINQGAGANALLNCRTVNV